MTKKIAIVYQGADYPGGIEQYLHGLFSAYDHKEVELTLVSLGEWDFSAKIKKMGEKTIQVQFKWYRFDGIYKLAHLFKENNFDLIVSQGMVANFYGRVSAFVAGIPALVTVHSNYEYDFAPFKRLLYFVTDLLLRPLTGKYITVSKSLKDQLVGSGVSPKKVKVIHNGVTDVGERQKKRTKTIVIGSIGRLHFTKGYHNLIHAAALIKDRDIKVKVWGEGKEREPLEDHAKSHGLTERIEFPGFTKDVSKALSQIDIYVQPSLAEGFGLTVVEAMLAGKPIVVTPRGALTELITDGKSGIVTKGTSPEALATAIRILIDDENLAAILGRNARIDALSDYAVEKWLEETTKVYQETAK